MTIGLPIPFSFQSSNVIDPTQTIDDLLLNCQVPIFGPGLEIRTGQTIYSYTDSEEFVPRIWDETRQDAGDYYMDEILFVPCNILPSSPMYEHAGKLIKVTGRDGSDLEKHERPAEPEEYDGWDEGHMNWRSFTHRYWRVPLAGANIKKTWSYGDRWYYFFFEDRSHNPNCGWRWSAKDKTATGERHFTMYLRTCMRANTSDKYVASKDVKAKWYYWAAPTSVGGKKDTYQFRSVIERNGYFYFRTHLNVPVQYKTWTTGAYKYTYSVVQGASDIPGFTKKRLISAANPFDGKSYTKSIIDTTETGGAAVWKLLATDEFNSLAVGRINAETLDIKIEDEDGNILFELNNYFIYNEVDDNALDNFLYTGLEYDTTAVLYMPSMMPSECTVTLTVRGDVVEVGEILGAKSVDAGFTKVKFKNSLKDFSPKEQDQWGNWDYIDGIKVHIHAGSVELPIARYDQLNRLMVLIGGRKVIINSSDSFENQSPDGRSIFDATMLIGRFTKFELDTAEKNKRIGDLARYNFTIEEIV